MPECSRRRPWFDDLALMVYQRERDTVMEEVDQSWLTGKRKKRDQEVRKRRTL